MIVLCHEFVYYRLERCNKEGSGDEDLDGVQEVGQKLCSITERNGKQREILHSDRYGRKL